MGNPNPNPNPDPDPTPHQVGGVYEIPVMLCNTSDISCRVRVLPPASRYFSISLISYPVLLMTNLTLALALA